MKIDFTKFNMKKADAIIKYIIEKDIELDLNKLLKIINMSNIKHVTELCRPVIGGNIDQLMFIIRRLDNKACDDKYLSISDTETIDYVILNYIEDFKIVTDINYDDLNYSDEAREYLEDTSTYMVY